MLRIKNYKRAFEFGKVIIIVQHGSADTVVRAMNVKYRKWRLGGACNSETP